MFIWQRICSFDKESRARICWPVKSLALINNHNGDIDPFWQALLNTEHSATNQCFACMALVQSYFNMCFAWLTLFGAPHRGKGNEMLSFWNIKWKFTYNHHCIKLFFNSKPSSVTKLCCSVNKLSQICGLWWISENNFKTDLEGYARSKVMV